MKQKLSSGENELHAICRKADFNSQTDNPEITKLLKTIKVNSICTTNGWEYTALHFACENTAVDLDTIKILIESKADVNLKNKYNRIPLFCALKNSNLAIIRYLIDMRSDINAVETVHGNTALHEACRHIERDLYLCSTFDLNNRNNPKECYVLTNFNFIQRVVPEKLKLVYLRAEDGYDEVSIEDDNLFILQLRQILSDNALPNKEPLDKIYLASYQVQNLIMSYKDKKNLVRQRAVTSEVVKYLIKYKALIDIENRYKQTPLQLLESLFVEDSHRACTRNLLSLHDPSSSLAFTKETFHLIAYTEFKIRVLTLLCALRVKKMTKMSIYIVLNILNQIWMPYKLPYEGLQHYQAWAPDLHLKLNNESSKKNKVFSTTTGLSLFQNNTSLNTDDKNDVTVSVDEMVNELLQKSNNLKDFNKNFNKVSKTLGYDKNEFSKQLILMLKECIKKDEYRFIGVCLNHSKIYSQLEKYLQENLQKNEHEELLTQLDCYEDLLIKQETKLIESNQESELATLNEITTALDTIGDKLRSLAKACNFILPSDAKATGMGI